MIINSRKMLITGLRRSFHQTHLPAKMSAVLLSSSLPTPGIEPSPTPLIRTLSSGSTKSLDSVLSSPSSSSSINLGEGEVEVVTEEGLRHAKIRHYKSTAFAKQLLKIITKLSISSWANAIVELHDIKVHKVSGSLTNAVFFVSCPSIPGPRTLLLRIYGASSGSLISRPRELHTLHILSSCYGIGPKIYGTFENGRVEEYFESTTLVSSDLRDPEISRWIGARMAELHSVDIDAVEQTPNWRIAIKQNISSWLEPAFSVLSLPSVSNHLRRELDLETFKAEWVAYMTWMKKVDDEKCGNRRVFAHNDTQYGNLLRITLPKKDLFGHRQIVVVDFEYAGPNPAAFDIANHFHEWCANYHSSTPQVLDSSLYPNHEQRYNFYESYLKHVSHSTDASPLPIEELQRQIERLDDQVRYWSPASHAVWAIWGIVQAREELEEVVEEPEFDYIGYARCRMAGFRKELQMLGITRTRRI